MHIPDPPDNFVYQEGIDDSTVPINPTLAQQQVTNNSSIMEDGNDSNESELPPSQFVNNNVANQQQLDINSSSNVQGGNPSQQSPIESPQNNLSQRDNNSQRPEEKQTFRPSNPILDEENLTSPDLSQIMNTNPFGENNSQRSEGQQTFRPSNPILDEVNLASPDLSQIMNTNPFGDNNSQRSERQQTFRPSDPIQNLSQSSDNSQNQQGYQNSSKGVPSEEQSTSFDF
ncbi:hypothetical protein RhiirA5_417545, partial [Rhizophagus irregularis]